MPKRGFPMLGRVSAEMARRHNKTGRSRKSVRFVMLEHYLLDSLAWRSLSLPAKASYIEIAQRYVPGNNGRIGMSARALADRLPISRQTAQRALSELVAKGFIEATKLGVLICTES